MRLLAIGAHPDDIEFGCGGTLIKFASKGNEVYFLVLTAGQEGSSDGDVRIREQERAARVMGVKEVFWGSYYDTQLETSLDLIMTIEKTIKNVDPTFIFVHYPEDTHQDHRNLASATNSATRYVKNVLYYEGPTTQSFTPNVFVDIATTIDAKIQALKSHASQVIRTNVEDLSIVDIALSAAHFRGIQGRVKYAEGFSSVRLFINV